MWNSVQLISSQSTPFDWLSAPSERDRASLIEFARGVLSSLSMREDGSFSPVHVSRIQRAFKRLGAGGLYKGGLRLIALLREAESLHGGYWLPTPYRVVEVEDELVFIGATPNAHGLLGNNKMEGLGRLLSPAVADRYPRQSLERWMDVTSQEPSVIVATFVAAHKIAEVRTSNLVDVAYLNINPSHNKGQSQFQWCDRAVGVLSDGQIAICRQSYRGRVRYFSASMRRGGVSTEAPLSIAIARLLFAIAHKVGAPVKAAIRSDAQCVEVTVSERLPIEEFRLAVLVSREIVRAGRFTTFLISPNLASAFCARLALLGCALETQK